MAEVNILIEHEVVLYDCVCGHCGCDMEIDDLTVDGDGDLRVKATCDHCRDEIAQLEGEIEELKSQLEDKDSEIEDLENKCSLLEDELE